MFKDLENELKKLNEEMESVDDELDRLLTEAFGDAGKSLVSLRLPPSRKKLESEIEIFEKMINGDVTINGERVTTSR